MPSPLLFFIFVIAIDLILKSSRDKKKIEQAKQKRTGELGKNTPMPSKPIADLRRILEEEVEKERRRELEKRQKKAIETKGPKPSPKTQQETSKTPVREQISWEIKPEKESKVEVSKPTISKIEKKEENLRKDIVRGIIFSEILSEPKSIQNQRKSL